jgi:hypothetical protein
MSKSKAKEYRELAEECDRYAATSSGADVEKQFLKMARRWRELEIREVMTGQ